MSRHLSLVPEPELQGTARKMLDYIAEHYDENTDPVVLQRSELVLERLEETGGQYVTPLGYIGLAENIVRDLYEGIDFMTGKPMPHGLVTQNGIALEAHRQGVLNLGTMAFGPAFTDTLRQELQTIAGMSSGSATQPG